MLPATTLANECYRFMFQGCERLINTPILPAPTLINRCYLGMFMECFNLQEIICLAEDMSNIENTMEWVRNVSDNGVFFKNPNLIHVEFGPNGVPEHWDVRDFIY